MKNKKIISLLLLLFIFSPHAIEAQQLTDTLVYFDEIVVSANRVYTQRHTISQSLSLINRSEIERSGESALLPVLSHRVPGLFVTQRGVAGFGLANGAAGTVNIRGVGQGNKVLMLFDGQPQWAGVYGHSLPDTYIAGDADRVEVIRGPASLIYGSNAMAGVVNIITRAQRTQGIETEASVHYGSYNTQKYRISNGLKINKLDTYISLNRDYTDGHRMHSQFEVNNGYGKVGYQFMPQLKLIADVSIAGYKGENPGMINLPMTDNKIDVTRGTAAIALENNNKIMEGALRLYYNWGNHVINDGYKQTEKPKEYLFHTKDFNYGVMLYQHFSPVKGSKVTLGIDYKNWGGRAWNQYYSGNYQEIKDTTVTEWAGYIIWQQQIGNKLILDAGVRYQYSPTYAGEWVPQVGIVYSVAPHTYIKGTFSRGFRPPSIRELYINFGPMNRANPFLKSEYLNNYEVGISQRLLEGKIRGDLSLFYIEGKDIISLCQTGKNMQLQNIGALYNKGVEVALQWQIIKQLNLLVNYSYLYTNQVVLAAPKHKAFIELTYQLKNWQFTLNNETISGLYLDNKGENNEHYTLFNGGVSYRFSNLKMPISLFIKGENLTNQTYCINKGYPMPGIMVMGGVSLQLKSPLKR